MMTLLRDSLVSSSKRPLFVLYHRVAIVHGRVRCRARPNRGIASVAVIPLAEDFGIIVGCTQQLAGNDGTAAAAARAA